jgi:two-component system cell cycle sensor histidine kinase/response regulator CckA
MTVPDKDDDVGLLTLGRLTAGISHDFNNLLTVISVAVDAILQRTPAPSETATDAAQARLAIRKGSALVKQLLALRCPPAVNRRLVSANQAINELAQLCRGLLSPDIDLKVQLEPTDPLIRMDRSQFDNIILNLALNARDAMPSGGTLGLGTSLHMVRAPQPEADTVEPGEYVRIEVSDTGHGISPDVLPHIFAPWFTTKKASGGLGLGLAGLIDAIHVAGGRITMNSAAGLGTTVRLLLPTYPAEPRQPDNRRGLVLLIENETLVRCSIERGLSAAGWEVLAAESGEHGIARCADIDRPLAIIIADASLSGMNGLTAIRTVRKSAPRTPAILISGYPESTFQDDTMGNSVTFLPKPFDLTDLMQEVEKIVNNVH